MSFLAGALGGGLLCGAILAMVAGSGSLDSKSTVTVQESTVVAKATTGLGRGLTVRQVYERDAPGVVFVDASGVTESQSPAELLKGEGGQQGTATGSGFEIDGNGTILIDGVPVM